MPAIKPARGENPYAKTAEWVAYCDLCGERFTRQKNNLDRSEGCYCSKKCRYEYARREKYGWHCPRCGDPLEGEQDWCSSEECMTANTDWNDAAPPGRSRYRHPSGWDRASPLQRATVAGAKTRSTGA